MQVVAALGDVVPPAQGVQDAEPTAVEYVPGVQGEHTPLSPGEYSPTGQALQTVAPWLDCWPDGHGAQDAEPILGAYVPGLQRLHVPAPD